MLDLERLRRAHVVDHPYRWARVTDIFSSLTTATLLASTVPTRGFDLTERTGDGDKIYRMTNRTLVADGIDTDLDDLAPAWRALVDQINSPEYRSALEDPVQRLLDDAAIELRLCRYAPECWMGPHTDRAEKLATHVVYLNRDWNPNWGGELRILNSEQMGDVAECVVPTLDSSVVLVRSDRSWHAVAPVRPGVPAARTSLLVHLAAKG